MSIFSFSSVLRFTFVVFFCYLFLKFHLLTLGSPKYFVFRTTHESYSMSKKNHHHKGNIRL